MSKRGSKSLLDTISSPFYRALYITIASILICAVLRISEMGILAGLVIIVLYNIFLTQDKIKELERKLQIK